MRDTTADGLLLACFVLLYREKTLKKDTSLGGENSRLCEKEVVGVSPCGDAEVDFLRVGGVDKSEYVCFRQKWMEKWMEKRDKKVGGT